MRSGTLSELMARYVPEGIIRLDGGHENKERSSMYEYQTVSVTSTLQGTYVHFYLIHFNSSFK